VPRWHPPSPCGTLNIDKSPSAFMRMAAKCTEKEVTYMNISGKTPLMQAKNLEKLLDVGEIYLKLEGANPAHHKYDRIAEVLVRDAVESKKRGLLIDGGEDYIRSVLFYAKRSSIPVIIARFSGERFKERLFKEEEQVRLSPSSQRMAALATYAKEKDLYNASSGYHNLSLSVIPLQKIGEEIVERLGPSVQSVFTQLSYGYTVTSLHHGFMDKWVSSELAKMPKIYSCTIPKGNFIFDDYKKSHSLEDLENYEIKVNKYTRELFTGDSFLLEETLKAIHDTQGNLLSIDESLLKESVQLLKKQENILLSVEEGYAFAGFYKMAKEGRLEKGKHVIVLNDGRSDLTMVPIKDFNTYDRETLGKFIESWLQIYKDPIEETFDALDHAIQDGHILLALRNNIPQGICLVVHTGFENFIPTYHLGYIATKEGNKGRGIATTLISEMLEITGGNLSLHVDIHNKRARKLYEKLGFEAKYYRMIHS